MRGEHVHAGRPGLTKAPTGIEGFDQITGGGLPRERLTLVAGGPGSGKTVFALQALAGAARDLGEPGVFVAFEENSAQVLANAAGFGWGLEALADRSLAFVDARLDPETVVVGGFDLTALLAVVGARAERMGARRAVFDAIDVLLALLDDPAAERRELYRLQDWAQRSGLTCLLTAKVDDREPQSARRASAMQFLVDCVVRLDQRVDHGVATRGLRVLKYRGSGFAANEAPMLIGPDGIEVAGHEPAEADPASAPASVVGPTPRTERVSTGIDRLDTMLSGGYYRGSSILISGSPGTAKSTLSGTFLEAACRRGERALYVSFDELAAEVVRNLESVGVRLAPHLASGLLAIRSARTESRSAEEHLLAIKTLIRAGRPSCLVIDPISAMIRAGGELSAVSVAHRLLQWTKSAGITLLCTSLLDRADGLVEAAEIPISTMADVWVHLSYVIRGGERNRALSIVKARGTRHSNQVRELVIEGGGIDLADVDTSGGEVLMGTARWERERSLAEERRRRRAEYDRRRRALELAEAEARSRMAALQLELESRRAELARLADEQRARDEAEARRLEGVRDLRQADRNGEAPAAPASTPE